MCSLHALAHHFGAYMRGLHVYANHILEIAMHFTHSLHSLQLKALECILIREHRHHPLWTPTLYRERTVKMQVGILKTHQLAHSV